MKDAGRVKDNILAGVLSEREYVKVVLPARPLSLTSRASPPLDFLKPCQQSAFGRYDGQQVVDKFHLGAAVCRLVS